MNTFESLLMAAGIDPCSAIREPSPWGPGPSRDPSAPPAEVQFDLRGGSPRAFVPDCRRCGGDEGFEAPDPLNPVNTGWVDCGCVPQRRRAELWNATRIPAALADCGLSRAEAPWRRFKASTGTAAALKLAEATVLSLRSDQPTSGMLLSGPPGTGKSHLVAAVISACTLPQIAPSLQRMKAATAARIARLRSASRVAGVARYTSATALEAEAHAAMASDSAAVTRLRDELVAVPVLGIDEMGDMRPGSWVSDLISAVVHQRHEHGLTTLVATNYSLDASAADALADRVPRHILSRIMALPSVSLAGHDWRSSRGAAQ